MNTCATTGESHNFTLAGFVRLLVSPGPGGQVCANCWSQGSFEEKPVPPVLSIYFPRASTMLSIHQVRSVLGDYRPRWPS